MITVPITARALVQRLNRAIAPYWRVRGTGGRQRMPPWYLIDLKRNTVRPMTWRDVCRYAREQCVLKRYERVV